MSDENSSDPNHWPVTRPSSLGPVADEPYAYARFRLEVALKAREREIDLLWSRSLLFWGAVAAAFAGTALAVNAQRWNLAFALSCFGFVCASIWTLANRGSRFWFLNWERKVEEYEKAIIGPVFAISVPDATIENSSGRRGLPWWRAQRYSPSRLIIALSDFVVAVWAAMLIYQLVPPEFIVSQSGRRLLHGTAAVLTLVYVWHVRRTTYGGEQPQPWFGRAIASALIDGVLRRGRRMQHEPKTAIDVGAVERAREKSERQ